MYGRGNFPPQRGPGPETSVSTSHKLVPPPYQNVNTTQQSQMMEKGPPFYPAPLVGQAFPPTYANEHHVPPPTNRILSSGQSYPTPRSLPPPPHTQVLSAPVAHSFSSPQQNSQWTQNVQHVHPPLPSNFGRPPSSRNGPEVLLPPPPPRPQPPPLSQGQAMFRGFVPSPLPGPVQGLQHTPLTQPPYTPYTHGHFGSVVHPTSQDHRGSSTGLLPPPLPPSPPPGPPPLPPASPPPPSPSSNTRSSGAHLPSPPLGHHVESDTSSNKHSIAGLLDSNSIARIPAPISDSSLDRGIDNLMDAGVSHSPADSNMDIEDEMTEIDENQKCSEIVEGVNDKSILISSDCEVEKQLHEPHIFASNTAPVESASGNIFCSDTSELAEHREDLIRSNASNAAAGVDYKSVSTELVTGTSAFKLLQDYASDDNSDSDHDPCIEGSAPPPVYPSGKSFSACVDSEKGSSFVTSGITKSTSESERGSGPSSERVVSLTASIPIKSLDSSLVLQGASREVDTTSTVKDKIRDANSHANQQYINSGISDKAFEEKSYGGSHVRPASDVGKTRKEDEKYNSSARHKVDEFGRLVREGGSDSDSDDLRHSRRHRKRGRIRNHSRSPNDRRSPQRRRQKRSRSRSWSPKKPRSRSRSPFRHGAQYGGDRTRRDKGPSPACFDYQRGKCYRGASCRYSHSDSTKGDLLRGYKNKYQTIQPSPEKTGKSVHKHDEDKSQEMKLCGDLSGSSPRASKDCSVDQKKVVSARNISDKDVVSQISSVTESVRTREEAAQVLKITQTREDLVESSIKIPDDNICLEVGESPLLVGSYVVDHVTDVYARKSPPDNTCRGTESLVGQNLHANVAIANEVLENADYQPQHMDVPSAHDPETLPASEANLNPLSVPEPGPDIIFDRSYPATGSASKSYSSETFSTQHLRSVEPSPQNSYQPSQFLPSPPPISQAANTSPQMPRDCTMMPQSSRYQSLPTSSDSFTPHQAPFPSQLASVSVSGNSAWNPLPPPPPPHRRYANDSTVDVSSSYGLPSSQFPENQLPLRNDFRPQVLVGPYSQVGEFHRQTYPPTQQPNQPLSHIEDNKSTALPTLSTMTQQFGGPCALGEGDSTNLPGHGGPVSSAEGSMHHQPMPLSGGSAAGGMQSFGSKNLHSGEYLSSSSQRFTHLQQPLDALQHLTAESVSVAGKPGKTNSEISSYNSDYFRRNLPSHVPDFVGSRISTYYNPYASTFEQPSSFNVSSNVFSDAKGNPYSYNYGDPLSSGHVGADGRVVHSLDSKNVTYSTNSNQAVEKMLLNSTDDQYDPLFDSIEPSSNSFRTPNDGQKHEITDDSDMNLRFSGSNKPLDFAENTKKREAEAVAVMSSLDNDEYGETAEAEVGAVENGSPSDPIDEANTAAGETEIDQVKTSGKSKKGKDSRSMKLFKVALAEFVKEVLKPSWRQGNMSKEAFKTIVKKTVDKVSGAMKSHQVPKSQAKIDHYIDSSQRKLTKLVMGYVDKYVKV